MRPRRAIFTKARRAAFLPRVVHGLALPQNREELLS